MKTDWTGFVRAFLVIAVVAVSVEASINGTPHDLSALSGGAVCRFCHTPHMGMGASPAWNREMSKMVYKIYESSSMEARVGQPTGASKLCLSCHDGTVALTQTLDGEFTGGAYMLPDESNLGTDLSDDHPISFTYSDGLSAMDTQIRPPSMLPDQLKLDRAMELQCTTCHDPHNNQYGRFLVMPNHRSRMCVACHDLRGWPTSSHARSGAAVFASNDSYLTSSRYSTVGDNACLCCHRPHSAGGRERLLHFRRSEDNCFSCHDGSVAQTNLRRELSKPSRHDVVRYDGIHDVRESPTSMARHVECADCHNPHAAQDVAASAPVLKGAMKEVSGITISGGFTSHSQYEYEVCFKCHGDNPNGPQSTITRQITQTNTRLEFTPSGPSFHPVAGPGVNRNVPSLKSPMTVAATIYCTDCHNSESSSGAKGPHGSVYRPLLERNYETSDQLAESEQAYALCYKCHSRNSILNDESFPKHRKHLEAKAPCSACHDPHGISSSQGTSSNNSHLINFDINIVAPDPTTGRREFVDLGELAGRCYLKCHDEVHSPKSY